MKELFKQNKLSERQEIEAIVKKKKQVEFKYESSIKPYKGHKVFEINLNDLTIKEADYVKRKDIHWFEAIKFINSGYKQEILIRKGCVYISALNKESALKRFKNEKGSATIPKGKLELNIF